MLLFPTDLFSVSILSVYIALLFCHCWLLVLLFFIFLHLLTCILRNLPTFYRPASNRSVVLDMLLWNTQVSRWKTLEHRPADGESTPWEQLKPSSINYMFSLNFMWNEIHIIQWILCKCYCFLLVLSYWKFRQHTLLFANIQFMQFAYGFN